MSQEEPIKNLAFVIIGWLVVSLIIVTICSKCYSNYCNKSKTEPEPEQETETEEKEPKKQIENLNT